MSLLKRFSAAVVAIALACAPLVTAVVALAPDSANAQTPAAPAAPAAEAPKPVVAPVAAPASPPSAPASTQNAAAPATPFVSRAAKSQACIEETMKKLGPNALRDLAAYQKSIQDCMAR